MRTGPDVWETMTANGVYKTPVDILNTANIIIEMEMLHVHALPRRCLPISLSARCLFRIRQPLVLYALPGW